MAMTTPQILILSMTVGFTGLGSWAVYERTGRTEAEAEIRSQEETVTHQKLDMDTLETENEKKHVEADQLREELESISLKNIRETLQQRSEVDVLLGDKSILEGRIKALEVKLKEHRWTTEVLDKTLSKTAVERSKLKEDLAAERNVAYAAQNNLKKKIQAVAREEKKSRVELQRARDERAQLEKGVAKQTGTIRALTDEVNRLSQELRRSVSERDTAVSTARAAQSTIHAYGRQDRQHHLTIHSLKHKLADVNKVHQEDHQEVQRLRVQNQSLANQIRLLHTEMTRLKGLLVKQNKPTRNGRTQATKARVAVR